MHRGFSHSLLFPFFAAPILAWILKKIYSSYTDVSFNDWFKMFFLAIITHPILDAQTTWGTQLFWPFEWRVAIENIFIIDPLYTCLLYTSPSPRDKRQSRMPSSA